jgi:hypothetical protein
MKAFPKIFTMGTDYIVDILRDEVEITEKIDGSQFDFGKYNGELVCRSKGKVQEISNPDSLFREAVDYVVSIENRIPDNTFFYAEYLKNPKHNNLAYEHIPNNHLILFGVSDSTENFISEYEKLQEYANFLEIDVVPLIYKGKITVDELQGLLERESVLGSVKIEGFVVKNYKRPFLLGGQPIPLMCGKYVSEVYKEVAKEWGRNNTSKGKWESFKESYHTETRWEKSVQHLRDNGELENSPRDIGKLIVEIKKDITEEEQVAIKNFLWNEFGEDLLRFASHGFPEWYKKQLLKRTK